MTARVRFAKIADGRYVQPETGIELIKGIDDSDGYDRIEWQIWTAGGPRHAESRPIGVRESLNAAKARAREIISAGDAA
jgi:hypothetical protein